MFGCIHVVHDVFLRLPPASMLRFSQCCSAFFRSMNDANLWRRLLYRDFPHYVIRAAIRSELKVHVFSHLELYGTSTTPRELRRALEVQHELEEGSLDDRMPEIKTLCQVIASLVSSCVIRTP